MLFLSKETVTNVEFPAFSGMFMLSQERTQEIEAVHLIKKMQELLQWNKTYFPEQKTCITANLSTVCWSEELFSAKRP